jgi:hypothetical protein
MSYVRPVFESVCVAVFSKKIVLLALMAMPFWQWCACTPSSWLSI